MTIKQFLNENDQLIPWLLGAIDLAERHGYPILKANLKECIDALNEVLNTPEQIQESEKNLLSSILERLYSLDKLCNKLGLSMYNSFCVSLNCFELRVWDRENDNNTVFSGYVHGLLSPQLANKAHRLCDDCENAIREYSSDNISRLKEEAEMLKTKLTETKRKIRNIEKL